MGAVKSAEEVRAEQIAVMGKDLGELFNQLSNEVSLAREKWHQYSVLYRKSPARIQLLNETAPSFFWVIQNALLEDTLLGIARLVGHPKSAGQLNLTLRRLPDLLEEPLKQEVEKLVEDAIAASDFARDWRNRHLAHRDLRLALRAEAEPLAAVTYPQVDEALLALARPLSRIESAKSLSATLYGGSWLTGGAETLLHVLKDGRRRRRDREGTWGRGEVHEDDLRPEPLP